MRAKKDEFYTQLSDIENELAHYRDFFRGTPEILSTLDWLLDDHS